MTAQRVKNKLNMCLASFTDLTSLETKCVTQIGLDGLWLKKDIFSLNCRLNLKILHYICSTHSVTRLKTVSKKCKLFLLLTQIQRINSSRGYLIIYFTFLLNVRSQTSIN